MRAIEFFDTRRNRFVCRAVGQHVVEHGRSISLWIDALTSDSVGISFSQKIAQHRACGYALLDISRSVKRIRSRAMLYHISWLGRSARNDQKNLSAGAIRDVI